MPAPPTQLCFGWKTPYPCVSADTAACSIADGALLACMVTGMGAEAGPVPRLHLDSDTQIVAPGGVCTLDVDDRHLTCQAAIDGGTVAQFLEPTRSSHAITGAKSARVTIDAACALQNTTKGTDSEPYDFFGCADPASA